MELIIHSYIGQAPVYDSVLKCTIYPTPGYKAPKHLKPAKPKPQVYSNQYKEQRSKNRDAIAQWLAAHGPATAKVIAQALGKGDQAIRDSMRWHTQTFIKLGEANDARRSVIYGLTGQTLDDMTINCNVEWLYERISKYLAEHGASKVADIAQALDSNENRVGSCLSNYRDVFEHVRVGWHDFVWKLKENTSDRS